MKPILTLALLALTTLALAGDSPDDGPRTPAARGALAKLEQAREKARVEYERAVRQAEDAAARELDQIKKQVMAKGDLDEANRIAAAIDRMEKSSPNPVKAGKAQYIRHGKSSSISLMPDGTIRSGDETWEDRWKADNQGRIVFANKNGTCVFYPAGENRFVGMWGDNAPVALIMLAASGS
jgi:hypothetical protein